MGGKKNKNNERSNPPRKCVYKKDYYTSKTVKEVSVIIDVLGGSGLSYS